MCEEIGHHIEMRPYGWVVLFDEVVTVHKGDVIEYRGLHWGDGKPEYERVCIRRGEGDVEERLAELWRICEEYLEFLASDGYCEDNDYEDHIFERAMEVVFGLGIWDRVDELIDVQEERDRERGRHGNGERKG